MDPVIGAIVDWASLGKVVAASLVAGLGVTAVYSLALAGAVRFVDLRRDGRLVEAAAFAVVALLAVTACVGAIVLGIVIMTTK